jgi:antitoxin ParD1/3/4
MAGKVQKLSISLPKEMVDHIRAAVDDGRYASSSEVVREAMREWQAPKRGDFPPNYPYVDNIEDLRRLIQEGIDQADRGELIPGEVVHAELRARFGTPAQKKKKRK